MLGSCGKENKGGEGIRSAGKGNIFQRVVREGPTEMPVSTAFKKVKVTPRRLGGRAFQTEGTAGPKSLSRNMPSVLKEQ